MQKLQYVVLLILMQACNVQQEEEKPLDYAVEVITAHRIQDKATLDTGFVGTQACVAVVPADPS